MTETASQRVRRPHLFSSPIRLAKAGTPRAALGKYSYRTGYCLSRETSQLGSVFCVFAQIPRRGVWGGEHQILLKRGDMTENWTKVESPNLSSVS